MSKPRAPSSAKSSSFLREASIEPAAEVGTQQIGRPVADGAMQLDHRIAGGFEPRENAGAIHRKMHRIPRAGMGELEIEQRLRRHADAGAAERNARLRETAQALPGVGDDELAHDDPSGFHAMRASAGRNTDAAIRAGECGPRPRRRRRAPARPRTRAPAQAEQLAHIERVVERGRLVVQHDVVGARHAHDEVARRRRPAASAGCPCRPGRPRRGWCSRRRSPSAGRAACRRNGPRGRRG